MERIDEAQADEYHNSFASGEVQSGFGLEQEMVKNRDSSPHIGDNSFHLGQQTNITASDNVSFSDNKDITSPQYIAESDAEQSEGDEDIKEEEDTVTQPAGFGDTRSGGIAGSRKARTRWWPPPSDSHNTYPSLQQRKAEIGKQVITLGRGQDSGRNRLAIFHDTDNVARLAFNIRVEGRTGMQWKGYPSPRDTVLPVGVSLSEVLAYYPNHVWNDGLRIFMAEGWQAERMWNVLPSDARNEGASTRKWNYLQQALGREADKVGQEQFGQKRVPDKRLKKDGPDDQKDSDDNDDGDSSDNAAVGLITVPANTLVGGSQTASQSLQPSNPHIMTSYAPFGYSFSPSIPSIAVSGVGKGRGRSRGQGQAGRDRSSAITRRRGPNGLAHPNLAN